MLGNPCDMKNIMKIAKKKNTNFRRCMRVLSQNIKENLLEHMEM